MNWIPLLFTVLACVARQSAARGGIVFTSESEDEADLYAMLPSIYELLPEIYDKSAAILSPENAERLLAVELGEVVGVLNDTNATTPTESSCLECRAFITLMEGVVNKGSYDEIEETFIDLCYILVNGSDDLGIPEHICPGIANNYLPHADVNPLDKPATVADSYLPQAVYVLNNTDMDAREICLFWNECLYYDFDPPYPENETLVCKPPPIPGSRRRAKDPDEPGTPRDLTNAIKVAHVTDAHVNGWYDVGSPTECGMPVCCSTQWTGEFSSFKIKHRLRPEEMKEITYGLNENLNDIFNVGAAGYWGDYNCNQPIRTNDVMLSYLATLSPHFVLYTGDNPPHTTWEGSYDSHYNMSALLVESFTRNMPGIRVLPALGNHDIFPVNMYFHERQDVKDGNIDLTLLWQDLAGFGREQLETFQYAAYYTTLLREGLRLVAYNSNYGWLENFYTLLRDRQPDYCQMRTWMEETLKIARQNGEKVILMSHHITGQSAGNNEYSCFITDVHARYADVIVLHLTGHKHGDTFRLVRDITSGETRGLQVSSPAAGTKTNRNPSMRIFYLDPVTFELLDSDVYRLNMSKHVGDTDGSPVPTVEFGYRFTEEYNVTDMSPASMETLVLRFAKDGELFNKYLYNEATANPDRIDDCDDECRLNEICSMTNTAYPGYLVCRDRIE